MSRNTIRSFNGRPSTPTPLPADIPFSVPAMTDTRSPEGRSSAEDEAYKAGRLAGFEEGLDAKPGDEALCGWCGHDESEHVRYCSHEELNGSCDCEAQP